MIIEHNFKMKKKKKTTMNDKQALVSVNKGHSAGFFSSLNSVCMQFFRFEQLNSGEWIFKNNMNMFWLQHFFAYKSPKKEKS